MVLMLLAGLLTAPQQPAAADSCILNGEGTADTPYRVGSADDLAKVGVGLCGLDASYVQTANIDLAGHGGAWTPIGTSVPFSGVYDGAEFSIDGFTVSWDPAPDGAYGLFGEVVGPGAELRSIRMSGATVNVNAGSGQTPRVGALAGSVAGGASILDTQVSGTVTLTTVDTQAIAGGIVAWSNVDVTFNNVSFNGTVSASAGGVAHAGAGGLVGVADGVVADGVGLHMQNVAFTGDVNGESSALTSLGGIVGEAIIPGQPRPYILGATVNATLSASGAGSRRLGGVVGYTTFIFVMFADVALTVPVPPGAVSSGVAAGGVVGHAGSTPIWYSQADVNIDVVSNGPARVGGIAGVLDGGSNISRSFSAGAASATNGTSGGTHVGGLAGRSVSSTMADSYSLMDLTATGQPEAYVGGLVGDLVSTSGFSRSYAAGTQSATSSDPMASSYAGGLAGGISLPDSDFLASFWDRDVTSSTVAIASDGPGVDPNTTGEMQTLALFADAGWDITAGWDREGTIWGICEGEAYPFLNLLTDTNPCSDPDPVIPPVVPPDDSDPEDPEPEPVLPTLPPGEGSGQVDGQDVDVVVEEQDGGLRLTGDGFAVEVRADVDDVDDDVDMFAAVRGRPLRIVGTGFAPDTPASAELRAQPYELGSVIVDGDGRFDLASELIPDQLTACSHMLHITGTHHGGGRVIVSVGLWVRPDQAPFPDVPLSATHSPAISCLADQGIVAGYANGTFQSERGLSRGEAAAMLYRMAGSPHVDVNGQVFDDVNAGHPFANAISWAHQQGIVQGYADGTYRPSAPMTRQAFAALLYRMAGAPVPAGPAPFVDVSPDTLFATEIAWLAEQNITRGYHDQTFRGATVVRRGPAATMLVRFQLATAQPDES